MPGSALHTLAPVNIHKKTFFSTVVRRDAEYHREQTFCQSVCKSKVLQMQSSDGAYRDRTSFGEATCLLNLRSVRIF